MQAGTQLQEDGPDISASAHKHTCLPLSRRASQWSSCSAENNPDGQIQVSVLHQPEVFPIDYID